MEKRMFLPMTHHLHSTLSVPLCEDKLEKTLSEQVERLRGSGLSVTETLQTIKKELLDNLDWGLSTIGKAMSWLANYECEQEIGRKRYQRDHKGRCKVRRDGYRIHTIQTHRGSITFSVPKLRNACFRSALLEPYYRYDPPMLKKLVPFRACCLSLQDLSQQTPSFGLSDNPSFDPFAAFYPPIRFPPESVEQPFSEE